MFMYLAVKGIRNCMANGHDQVFLVAYVGYLLVSIGSFLFHATLKCTLKLLKGGGTPRFRLITVT